ncbi:MAG: hypothetical protein ABIA04_11645 [Pseudomonadota bacterium]
MNYDYSCPHCKGHLRVNDQIIVTAKKENGTFGMLLLDPQLGDYSIVNHPSFDYEEGEKLDIHCPMCNEDLAVKGKDYNLAKIHMEDHVGTEFDIYFSTIVGEKVTYKIKGEEMEVFGDEIEKYTNFFGEPLNYF